MQSPTYSRARGLASFPSILLLGVLLSHSLTQSAHATTYAWNHTDGPWSVFLYWSPQGIPQSSGDRANVQCNLAGANRTVSFPAGDIDTLWVDTNSTCSMMTLGQSTGTFGAEYAYIGANYRGTYDQLGGTANFDHLYLGRDSTSNGYYNLSGASSILNVTDLEVGMSGDGHFFQSGGLVDVSLGLWVGCGSGSSGTYQVTGQGDIDAYSIIVGRDASSGGYFLHNGEKLIALRGGLVLGTDAGSSGVFRLQAGASGGITTRWTTVGSNGEGDFHHLSGQHSIFTTYGTGDLRLKGSYELFAGSLHVGGDIVNTGGSTSLFSFKGGTLQVLGDGGRGTISVGQLLIADDVPPTNITLNLSGASDEADTLIVDTLEIGSQGTGTLNQSSTTSVVQAVAVKLGVGSAAIGEYNFSGGSLSADTMDVGVAGAGEVFQSGSTSAVLTGALTNDSGGTYHLLGGALSVDEIIMDAGVSSSFEISGGALTLGDRLTGGRLAIGTPDGSGSFTLQTGQTIEASSFEMGDEQPGSFYQVGGTVDLLQPLAMSVGPGGAAHYELNGGFLDPNGLDPTVEAFGANAEFQMNGGTILGDIVFDSTDFQMLGGSAQKVTLQGPTTSYSRISGGSLTSLEVYDGAEIRLDGSGFLVNGVPAGSGPIAALSGTISAWMGGGYNSISFDRDGPGSLGTIIIEEHCGDGILDPEEACDDGNNDAGDCCSAQCRHDLNGQVCQHPDACVFNARCDGAGTCVAQTYIPCFDDGDVCTIDVCVDGLCNTPAANGILCDDANGCTTADACSNGICVGQNDDGAACNDSNGCTLADSCLGGSCQGSAVDCDDALWCTGTEYCNATGINTYECRVIAIPCSDGLSCTGRTCVEGQDPWCSIDPAPASCQEPEPISPTTELNCGLFLGSEVAIDADRAAVGLGCALEPSAGGEVTAYDYFDPAWVDRGPVAPVPGFESISELSIEGDWMLVSAGSRWSLAAGTTHLFRRNGSNWVAFTGHPFGDSESNGLSGDVAITYTGSGVEIARYNLTSWVAENFDQVPCSAPSAVGPVDVAIFDETAAVLCQDSIELYVFGTSEWEYSESIATGPLDPGSSLDMDDSVIAVAVSGPGTFPFSWSMRAFRKVAGMWTEDIPGPLPTDQEPVAIWFGVRVAVSGGLIIVGAPEDDTVGPRAGAAFVFEHRSGSWEQIMKIMPAQTGSFQRFGMSVDLSGTRAIIGGEGAAALPLGFARLASASSAAQTVTPAYVIDIGSLELLPMASLLGRLGLIMALLIAGVRRGADS